jgi:hypothetical protein
MKNFELVGETGKTKSDETQIIALTFTQCFGIDKTYLHILVQHLTM